MSRQRHLHGGAVAVVGVLLAVALAALTHPSAPAAALASAPLAINTAAPSPTSAIQLGPSAVPTPSTSPPGASSPSSGSTFVAPWDIPGLIGQAIDSWFSGLVVAALNGRVPLWAFLTSDNFPLSIVRIRGPEGLRVTLDADA